jgi:hypothetical protein
MQDIPDGVEVEPIPSDEQIPDEEEERKDGEKNEKKEGVEAMEEENKEEEKEEKEKVEVEAEAMEEKKEEEEEKEEKTEEDEEVINLKSSLEVAKKLMKKPTLTRGVRFFFFFLIRFVQSKLII